MADKMTEIAPCPFCGMPLTVRGGFNPMGQCETPGCWMHERHIGFPVDDPKQVAAWNARSPSLVDGAARTAASELADKLQRFIDMPEWQRFYMDKEQAAACVAALGSAS